jgi:hypothetical protein
MAIGLAVVLLGQSPVGATQPPLGGAWVSAVEGEALVQTAEEPGWGPALLHLPLLPGDRLQTAPTGRIEVLVNNGTAIRLGPGSTARFVAVPSPEAGRDAVTELDMEAGRAIVVTRDGERSRPALTLNASGTRVQVYPQSKVRAETMAPDITEVRLLEGAATADTLGTSIPLRVGEVLQVGRGGAFLVAGGPQDTFDHWSDSRDRIAAAPPPPSYVPPPLAPYTTDLNAYGEWTAVPEYGYVWRPTTVVTGWAPFTDGRWVWRGGTWVWLPREPWGWVPFHYGRWRWHPHLRWFWVPPRPKVIVWCPGAVAWIQTSSHVAWIPLAPGEIYYGPWGLPVSHTTVIKITHVHIHKRYVNAAAPAAVVAVPAGTFSKSTVVTSPASRVSLTTLGPHQGLKIVTPAALAPARVSGGPVSPAVPVAVPQARARIEPPKAPLPPALQASRQVSGSTQPARPALTVTAPPAPASSPRLAPGQVSSQSPAKSVQPKIHPRPVDRAGSSVGSPPIVTPSGQPSAAGRPRHLENRQRHEPRSERHELPGKSREAFHTPAQQVSGGVVAPHRGPHPPIQERVANRYAGPPAAIPPQAPDRHRNGASAIPSIAPGHRARPHGQSLQPPAPHR